MAILVTMLSSSQSNESGRISGGKISEMYRPSSNSLATTNIA